MKHIILPALAALALATACSHEEVDTYDTSRAAINIGFGSQDALTPAARYNFSEASGERAVTFYARISGIPADYDRTFTLEACEGDLELVRGAWRTDTYVIPAGEVGGEYTVWFDSSHLPDASAFTASEGSLVLRPVPNEHFAMGAQGHNTLEFTLVNYLAKPDNWDVATESYTMPLKNYFGEYSVEKFRFMIENGCPVKFSVSSLQGANVTTEGDNTIFSTGYATYLKQKMQQALKAYNASHGQPLSDSYGNPIIF